MCKSLPASHLAFSLYEACPFELPPVDKSAFCLTTPADDSGAAHPEYCGVCGHYSTIPADSSMRTGFDMFEDFSGSLDAPDWLPRGSVVAGAVHSGPYCLPFLFGRTFELRAGL